VTLAGPVAAVDCGTNSTRLLILAGDGTQVSRLMRITRLGEGVDATGLLAPQAIDRTLGVLSEYRTLIDKEGATSVRLVATSAARDAKNGEDFLREASAVIGAPAELLDGQAEGRLAWEGASSALAPSDADDVVVDIGGGSTEIVHHRRGAVRSTSLDIGCVRVTERYFHHDPPTSAELRAAETDVSSLLRAGLAVLVEAEVPSPPGRLIGLAGTITTLAALDLGLEEYDPGRIHHTRLSRAAVDRWYEVLSRESSQQRALRRVIAPGREDVIVGGALILRAVMDVAGFESCLVSESDMLDGLALGMLRPGGDA